MRSLLSDTLHQCDGEQPQCGPCCSRAVKCVYTEKHPDSDAMEASHKVLDLLRTVPESQAREIVRMLRTNGNTVAVLLAAKAEEAKGQGPSTQASLPVPRQHTQLQFELAINNPASYPVLRSITTSALERSNYLRPFPLRRTRSSHDQRYCCHHVIQYRTLKLVTPVQLVVRYWHVGFGCGDPERTSQLFPHLV